MSIIGYKVFNPDWTCRGMKYEVGKTYKHDGPISICEAGFHFCRKVADCFNYYRFDPENKVAEVEATGLVKSVDTKSVTDEIKILREIPWAEMLELANEGKGNTGLRNSGNGNSGNLNTGSWNTGSWNSGNGNTGGWNSGDWNTGDVNTGSLNTGDRNIGNGNTGNRNKGSCNIGNCNLGYDNVGGHNTGDGNIGSRNKGDNNIGDWNTGNYNIGDQNTGDGNTGHWNSGNFNTGWFSTITPKIDLFEKPSGLTYEEIMDIPGIQVLNEAYENNWWIFSKDMTDEEKAAHPEHETLGGYLKSIPFKDACALMWNKLSEDDKRKVLEIPNFDADIFYRITGIQVGGRTM